MWCGFDIMISSEGGTEVCVGGYGVAIRARTPYIDDRSDMLDPGVPWYACPGRFEFENFFCRCPAFMQKSAAN